MISARAFQLILDYEVGGGEEYYDAMLARPTWPGAQSGVTVGIGYDLGYSTAQIIRRDWAELPEVGRLAAVAGLKGERCKRLAAAMHDVVVPWDLARSVFCAVTLPREAARTIAVFPGSQHLPQDAFGALVSLVYNRGGAMDGDRRREMRAIREAVTHNDLDDIAEQLRSMKRLWRGRGLDGLVRRRESEAVMVETAQP
jgi:GH24 family phage-related lysozyme (muramidase)